MSAGLCVRCGGSAKAGAKLCAPCVCELQGQDLAALVYAYENVFAGLDSYVSVPVEVPSAPLEMDAGLTVIRLPK